MDLRSTGTAFHFLVIIFYPDFIMSTTEQHEIVVIGAGPGGYRAAFMAADLGMKTTLIDSAEKPGRDCI